MLSAYRKNTLWKMIREDSAHFIVSYTTNNVSSDICCDEAILQAEFRSFAIAEVAVVEVAIIRQQHI
ncbi:unnamed protein product [Wuchereria bancrofti]|uniref:Uncharacterized protein n=1 Tax=Wuchereria bancrofti TaxID=6293 RepID=A0A3P7DRJ2_WUCBA|nr:unnamed protein product [Wuchereria bancrofti]